jgi:4-amino-4-deoxy-L-arabinose transferase-like glycosyltransferase
MSALNNNVLRIGLLGVALRLLFILPFSGPDYYAGISRGYLEVASNILEGRGITVLADVAPVSSPTPQWSYEPFIDRPLGYHFFILLPYWILRTPVAIQVFQALLAFLSIALLYACTKRLFSEKVAVLASLLFAVWPLSARFEITIAPDAVMSFFLLFTLWLFLQALEHKKPYLWYVGSGLVCGIGMTMRPDVLLLPFFFALWLLFNKTVAHRLYSACFLLLGAGIIIGAHTIRNYEATGGEIVPLGLGNGISLWEGISQFGDTLGTVYGDERMTHPKGVERDRKRFAEALSIISQHPWWYTGVMIKRIPLLLTPDWIMTNRYVPSLKEYLGSSADNSVIDYVRTHPLASSLRAFLIVLQYTTLVLAVLAVWKAKKNYLIFLPALIVFYYIALHLVTNAEARYFYPAIPFALMLASYGWETLRHRKQPTLNDHAR